MARKQNSVFRRSFAQVDLAFWCIHEHFATLFVLSLPTLLLTGVLATSLALVQRTWDLPAVYSVPLYGLLYPALGLWLFTFVPLPCAVFAWHRSLGEVLNPAECLRAVADRSGRLAKASLRLIVYYFLWFLCGGLPMLWFWPRTCLAPMVVLFEREQPVFRRARRLLKEDVAVHILAIVHLCLFVALGVLVYLPRILIASNLIANPLTTAVTEYLWVFELLASALVMCGLAVSWCLSLTLLYYHVRKLREGESLRQRIADLRAEYSGGPAGNAVNDIFVSKIRDSVP